jgi:hypothetical protein
MSSGQTADGAMNGTPARRAGGRALLLTVADAKVARVLLRLAAVCGLVAPLTSSVGWAVGGLAQPDAYSSADDDISDLGALTASSAWIYNQIGANLTGLLVIAFALGLWRALSPNVLGRASAGVLVIAGLGAFLDGLFRLDCQGIDGGCENDSWHSAAHKMEGRVTTAAIVVAPLVLAFAFRRLPEWRDTWLPTLAAVPASLLVGVVFSGLGDGAATRASTLTWFLWLAFVAFQLLRKGERSHVRTES